MQREEIRGKTSVLVKHPSPVVTHGIVTQLQQHGYVATSEASTHDASLVAITHQSWETPHRHPRIAILDTPDPATYRMAYALGAAGVFALTQPLPSIIRCIGSALAGEPTVPLEVLRYMSYVNAGNRASTVDLDDTEVRILQLKAAGLSLSKIAADVGYSEHTVSNKVHKLCRKLGVENSSQAIARAAAFGLLDAPPQLTHTRLLIDVRADAPADVRRSNARTKEPNHISCLANRALLLLKTQGPSRPHGAFTCR